MNLRIQLLSIFFSFAYGLIFSILYILFTNFLYKPAKRYKILINLLFVTVTFLIFFIILKIINNGMLHFSLFFIFFSTFLFFQNRFKNVVPKINVKIDVNDNKKLVRRNRSCYNNKRNRR